MTPSRSAAIALAGLLVGSVVSAQETARTDAGTPVVTNAPAALEEAGVPVLTNVTTVPTPPGSFVAIQPCRLADTRGFGFTGPFGPPSLLSLTPRIFPAAGYCGIPATAKAVSANLTVTGPVGPGWVSIWPDGAPMPSPLVAAITHSTGQTISNAFVAPLGATGGITLYSLVATQIVIDLNGYYRGPAIDTCKLVGNMYWCYNPDACGQACNDVCASLGLRGWMPSDTDWFAAQDTAAECQAISEAFGLGSTVNFGGYTYACLEDTPGAHTAPGGLTAPLYCSNYAPCPTNHRTTMDQQGIACAPTNSRRSICPCM